MPQSFLGDSYKDLSFDLGLSFQNLPIGGPRLLRPRQLTPSEFSSVVSNKEIPNILKWSGVTAYLKKHPNLNGSEQTVVIIDSGVNSNHVDLAGAIKLEFDCAENKNSVTSDLQGHGTHMAGIIAGRGIGDPQMKGVATGANIVSMKVTKNASDEATWWSIENALRRTVDLVKNPPPDINDCPVSVVNLSFNAADNIIEVPFLKHHHIVRDIEVLNKLKVPVVVSAGNRFLLFNIDGIAYPSYANFVVAVGAYDDQDSSATEMISNFSQRVESNVAPNFLAAPAFAVSCGIGATNSYSSLMGTSVSAAIISGMILLIKQHTPNLANEQIRRILRDACGMITIGPSQYRRSNLI